MNWPDMKVPALAILCVLATALLRGRAAVPFQPLYQAQGKVVFDSITADDSSVYQQVFWFNLAENAGGQWKLDLETLYPDPKLQLHTREIISFDGNDIYSVVYSTNKVMTPRGGSMYLVSNFPLESNQHPARICSGPYPIDHSSAAGVIWLSFLSGKRLEGERGRVRFPNLLVTHARRDPLAWLCDFDYSLLPGTRILSSGEYILNKKHISKRTLDYAELDEAETSTQHEELQKKISQYAAFTNDWISRAKYQLLESNLVNGVVVPTRFQCSTAPIPEAGHLRGRFQGTITNVLVPLPGIFCQR